MTSNDVQPEPVQSASLLERSSTVKSKLMLNAGQPPRSENKRASKRANDSTDGDSIDGDSIDAQGSKRSKVNDGSALEAPVRRRSTSSMRDSKANTTKLASRSAMTSFDWKDEYEKLLDELKKTRDTTRETGLAQAGKPLIPLCAEYGIYVANWPSSDPTISALTGYLNLHCAAQVGALWTICRGPLRTLHNSHAKHYNVTDGVFEKAGLSAFIQSLDSGTFKVEDITSTVEPTIDRGTDGYVSEYSQYLMLARFINQVFSVVANHRQQDHDFPNVFSGAGGGLNPRVLFEGSLRWITEDMHRVLSIWACFASRLRKKNKNVNEEKYHTLNRKDRPLVLPIFMRRPEPVNDLTPIVASRPAALLGQDLITRTAESSVAGSLAAKKRADPLTDFLMGHGFSKHNPSSAIGGIGTRNGEIPSAVDMAIGPAMGNLVDHSITTAIPLDRLASFTELNSTANARPNALMESDRSGTAPTPSATTQDESQPNLGVLEPGASPSLTIKASSSTVHNRPSTAGLFRQLMESNLVTSQSRNDEPPVDKHSSIRRSSGGDCKAELKRKLELKMEEKAEALEVKAEKDRVYLQEMQLKDEVDMKMVAMMQAKYAQVSDELGKIGEETKITDELTQEARSERESDAEALRLGNLW
ncbi:hypothetical protein LTR27_008366 [Elasticomyces elasticus]|nr:hypothetical protein LTR27_008366 [Elasticomyces elasticus]